MSEKLLIIDIEKKHNYLLDIEQNNEPETYKLYKKLILKLDEFEEYKGISAANMTKVDFMEFFTSLNSVSLSTLYTYKSIISSYLIFITDEQKFTIGVLELDKITQEDLIICINKKMERKQFLTEKEYYKLLDDGEGNYQDKLVMILLWNGIKGDGLFTDILDLKIEDINIAEKSINTKNGVIYFTDKEMDMIERAIKEEEYTKITASKKGVKTKTKIEYVSGKYLIKATSGARNKNSEMGKRPYGTFANRMSKYYNTVLERSELTNIKIYKSGLYHRMITEYGRKLTSNELIEYSLKHNVKFSLSNSYREQDIIYSKMVEQGLI